MRSDYGMPVYINKPINNEESDFLGLASNAKLLRNALDKCKTAGIIGNYGTGKSSLINFFINKYKEKDTVFAIINLWNTNNEDSEKDQKLKIHFNFLQQLAMQVKGSKFSKYVNKRLNKNYRNISLAANVNSWKWVLGAMIFFIMYSIVSNKYQTKAYTPLTIIDFLMSGTNVIGIIFFSFFILSIIKIIYGISIVYSDGKNNNEINENDIVEVYKEILHQFFYKKNCLKLVIIIEDLDRSTKKETRYFLESFNRLYIDSLKEENVKFIINVRAEDDLDVDSEQFIYSKIFNYIIRLNPVNINNYEEILDSLLLEKKNELGNIGIEVKNKDNSKLIEGMDVIIYGKGISFRDIKERLNYALQLYISLIDKAESERAKKAISFKKCAIVAYLDNAFPQDFHKLIESNVLEGIVLGYAKGSYKNIELLKKKIKSDTGSTNEEFVKEIASAIDSKLIDISYNLYIYNYPKNAYFRTISEQAVYNAIIYEDVDLDINKYISDVVSEVPEFIEDVYKERWRLKETLPEVTFENNILFIMAIEKYMDGVKLYLNNHLSFYSENVHSSIIFLNNLFSVENINWHKANSLFAEVLCEILTNKFIGTPKEYVLEVRKIIIKHCKEDILLYSKLFKGIGIPIDANEVKELGELSKVIKLSNGENITVETVDEINRIVLRTEITHEEIMLVNEVYENVAYRIIDFSLAQIFIKYIKKIQLFTNAIEDYIVRFVDGENISVEEYLELLNLTNGKGTGNKTSSNLEKLNIFEGLNKKSAIEILENKNQALFLTHYFSNEVSASEIERYLIDIKNNINYIKENCPNMFWKIRTIVIDNIKSKKDFYFLFYEPLPIIKDDEINKIKKLANAIEILDPMQVTEDNMEYITKYISEKCGRNAQNVRLVFKTIEMIPNCLKKKFFYTIDFSNIKYKASSAKYRNEFIHSIEIELDIVENESEIIRFMKHINSLEPILEERLVGDSQEINNDYVELINSVSIKEISNTTIETIKRCQYFGLYNHEVQQILFDNKLFEEYVYAKIKYEESFVFEKDKIDILKIAYLSLLKNKNLKNSIHVYMLENCDFLQYICNEDLYSVLDNDNIISLSKLEQNEEILYNIFLREDNVIIEYLKKLENIKIEIKNYIIQRICNKDTLLISGEVYVIVKKILEKDNLLFEFYKKKRNNAKQRVRRSLRKVN